MGTETQALTRGTRVDEDERREAFLAHLEQASKIVATWPAWKQTLLGGTARMEQPEPTVGQLVDQMDTLILEACDRVMIDKPCVDIRIFGNELTFVDIKWFRDGEPTGPEYTKGKTPQEAIRAMIDRLKDMLGHTTV